MIQIIKRFRAFPPQVRYIVGNEACERFSFYGMRSILIIFMIEYLKIPVETSKAVYHLFAGAVYLLPLVGAYVADRFLGKYRTILYLSILYCFGHLALALWENLLALYLGLGMIAIGSGGIKPCVSAYVGDQFTKESKHLLQKVFDLFYWSINFGSVFSSLLIPWLLPRYGSGVAFGIPGVLMAIATFLFWMGRRYYVNVPPSGNSGPAGFMPILLYALTHQRGKKLGQGFFDVALKRYSAEE